MAKAPGGYERSVFITTSRIPSENFNPDKVAGGAGNPRIPCDESGSQSFCQGHVGRIVGGEVVAQGPDSRKQYLVRITFER